MSRWADGSEKSNLMPSGLNGGASSPVALSHPPLEEFSESCLFPLRASRSPLFFSPPLSFFFTSFLSSPPWWVVMLYACSCSVIMNLAALWTSAFSLSNTLIFIQMVFFTVRRQALELIMLSDVKTNFSKNKVTYRDITLLTTLEGTKPYFCLRWAGFVIVWVSSLRKFSIENLLQHNCLFFLKASSFREYLGGDDTHYSRIIKYWFHLKNFCGFPSKQE